MADIFLSYSSADRIRARAIASLLEKAGWSVWMDRYMPGGMEWNPHLDEELQIARCVVVLWTRDSIHSEWVQREARSARERNVLLPVLLHPVTPPGTLAEVHAIPATAWIDEENTYELQPLIQRVAAFLGANVPLTFSVPARSASVQMSKVEVAEATFQFCAARLDFFHERKSGAGAIQETIDRMQSTYKRLVDALSPVSSDDIHALITKHENAFTPRDETDA